MMIVLFLGVVAVVLVTVYLGMTYRMAKVIMYHALQREAYCHVDDELSEEECFKRQGVRHTLGSAFGHPKNCWRKPDRTTDLSMQCLVDALFWPFEFPVYGVLLRTPKTKEELEQENDRLKRHIKELETEVLDD